MSLYTYYRPLKKRQSLIYLTVNACHTEPSSLTRILTFSLMNPPGSLIRPVGATDPESGQRFDGMTSPSAREAALP